MWTRDRIVKVFVAALGVFTGVASALAGGGNVLPATANPKGYSLSDIAVATADYNTDPSSTPPNVPFEILVGDTTVTPGTTIYLPIFFANDSPPVDPAFPTDIGDQAADAEYLLDTAGVEAFIVDVDGETTILNEDYIRGVTTAPMLGGGTHYIVSAAFLTPLTPGEHTVGIGGVLDVGPDDDDEPVVFVSYNVTVR